LDPIRVPQKYQNKKSHRGENKGELSCNPLGKNPGDVWAFQNVKHNHEEQTIHPCQFPEDLISRIILASTEVNDVVFDPYGGTGTVAVVAKDLNRQFIVSEIDKTYVDIAQRRLDILPDEKNSFPNLKTLRKYIERTGEPIEKYRFDVQVGKVATPASSSKIFSEQHHLADLEQRLEIEEGAFSERLLLNKINPLKSKS
jgi:adenine-specific DNA-methyltransferase